MPNWCENCLTIIGDSKKIAKLLRSICNEEGEIDFEKIIPSPKTIEECPERYIVKEEEKVSISREPDRPWFNWYEWQCNNWGTKWNADYSSDSLLNKAKELEEHNYDGCDDGVDIFFSTAWSPAIPIAEKLIEDNKDLNIELKYFEWGMWYGGIVDEYGNRDCEDDTEIKDLAVEVFGYEYSDFEEDEEDEEEEDEFADDEF